MDVQVISKESKCSSYKDDMFPNGWRGIETVITFKVFHWIKSSIQSDEVTFYEQGGKISDSLETVSPSSIYSLNKRAIIFLGTKIQIYI